MYLEMLKNKASFDDSHQQISDTTVNDTAAPNAPDSEDAEKDDSIEVDEDAGNGVIEAHDYENAEHAFDNTVTSVGVVQNDLPSLRPESTRPARQVKKAINYRQARSYNKAKPTPSPRSEPVDDQGQSAQPARAPSGGAAVKVNIKQPTSTIQDKTRRRVTRSSYNTTHLSKRVTFNNVVKSASYYPGTSMKIFNKMNTKLKINPSVSPYYNNFLVSKLHENDPTISKSETCLLCDAIQRK